MQRYVEDLINELHAFSELDFVSDNSERYLKCNKSARETLAVLDAARRKLIEEKRELAKQLLNVPHWVKVSSERPTYSKDYVVRIANASFPTTLFYNTATRLWYGDENDVYNVTHWLKGLEMPEV